MADIANAVPAREERVSMPVRSYPLDIQSVGEDTYIVMSKGHHDAHEFMSAVREAGYDWPLGMPAHRWMRAIPTRAAGYRCMYVDAKPGSRGAWPATYAHEAYGQDMYEQVASQAGTTTTSKETADARDT